MAGITASTVISIISLIASSAATGVSVGVTAARENRQDLLRTKAYQLASKIYKQLDNAGVIDSIINKISGSDTKSLPSTIYSGLVSSVSAMNIINAYNAEITALSKAKTQKLTDYQSSSSEISSKIKEIDSQLSAISNQVNVLGSFASGKKQDTANKEAEISKLNKEAERLISNRKFWVSKLTAAGEAYQNEVSRINSAAANLTDLNSMNAVQIRSNTPGTSVGNVMQVPNNTTGGQNV